MAKVKYLQMESLVSDFRTEGTSSEGVFSKSPTSLKRSQGVRRKRAPDALPTVEEP